MEVRGEREADAGLLADLRAILPTVWLFNIFGPRWLLLDHVPSPERKAQGERLKLREYARLKEGLSARRQVLALAELQIEGYSLIGQYEWTGDAPRALLLTDLRKKQRATEAELNAALDQAEALAERGGGEAAADGVERFIEAEGRELFAITARGRKAFVQPGA